jgi:hypothetical protein
MTVRKEMYIVIKGYLKTIERLELIDLQKGQFENNVPEVYGNLYTACLIEIGTIDWETMTNHNQEGKATISIYLYVKDGFAHQHEGTTDQSGGFNEIDLIDNVVETLHCKQGQNFKALHLTREQAIDNPSSGIMAYRLDFETWCYNSLPKKYVY